ncbi:NUDIX hydrolase [Methanogenium cariaci]|jgi:ADP-ribose diphosphatase
MTTNTPVPGKKKITLETVTVTLPSGVVKERRVVHPGHAVAMLPVEGDFCYLERQYRFAVDEWIYEAPAGTIDPGETPEETAYRELIEETGMAAETLIPRGKIYPSPGYTDEVIYLFEACGLSPSDAYGMDDDEQIEVVKVSLHEMEEMIRDGRIIDAKTICLAYHHFRGQTNV